ncbi:MFS superfamily sulfate permease-like transporter [Nonomuraea thailandensis]|uniref:MFS superfamily sulfate permease-like transporter n=1 Tax=Nonomuraea thailandensis TaxID=1188745 RepID=A0A9X2GRR2_9ACTN|nr:SulP family inorganic anion transporter [Nonomuraea thailandensis]MCP2362582.1 MFS superfamily sulfate permease-like transporter [Nonomuraea thailandensis]
MTFAAGLRGVRRGDLGKEITAGVTLAALAIPLNIGYAQIAGLPPVVGLYTAILPMPVFALCCSSRQLVASPDAPIAALIASLLAALAVRPGSPQYVEPAYAQALVCAAVFLLFYAFRLGFLASFLSEPVLVGFIAGLAVEILTSQIKKILGIHTSAEGFFPELWEIVTKLPQSQWWSVVVGSCTIAVILLLRRIAPALPTPHWPGISLGQWAALVPGAVCAVVVAVVYRFESQLFFANAGTLKSEIEALADRGARHVVLDAEAISDVDTTGAQALRQVADLLRERGVGFSVSRATTGVRRLPAHYGLTGLTFHESNQAAAAAFQQEESCG